VRLLDTGAPNRRIVFLHEGLGSIEQWRGFPERMCSATGLGAMVYDRRNHGRSDALSSPRGRDYHTEEAAILEELIDALELDAMITYGHSDGATIALLHAARYPDRVAAVVSEAGHIAAEPRARAGIERARERFTSGDLRMALERHHGAHTDAMFAAWADTWLDPSFEDWTIRGELAPLMAPALVLQGDNDEYASPEHVAWIAAEVGGPVETWLVPNTGHAPHRERTEAVIDRVTGFLARHGLLPR
jgi:pimeloyl-ACP methyl ester carboxylesterase